MKKRRGDSLFLFMLSFTVVIALMVIANGDLSNFYNQNMKVKSAVNRAVKAASMQLDTTVVDLAGENLSAQGIFLIDEVKAEEAFKEVLTQNLGLDDELKPLSNSILSSPAEIIEFKILNDYQNMPYDYTSPVNGKTYNIKNPCVLTIMKIQIKSFLINKEMIFGRLSSSELMNKNQI